MKNDLTCAVAEDLLPSYVEGLTSPETNEALERHLAACPACAQKRAAMGQPEREETAREVDYLKTVKRRGRKRVVLAVVCTVLVLAAGLAAKLFVIGEPASREGMSWSLQEDGNALNIRVFSANSGIAYCRWTVREEDAGVVRLRCSQVLPSPLYSSADHRERISLEGVREVWLADQLVWQEGVEITRFAQALYETQTPYAGDASAVGNLLAVLDTWYGPSEIDYTISLQTESEPCGLTLHFDAVTAHIPGAGETIRQRMETLAPALLALVRNLGQVNWAYADENGVWQNQSITLEEAEATLSAWVEASSAIWSAWGLETPVSLKDLAASPAGVQRLIDLADYGFGHVFYDS